jgi:hypothetical protein
MRWHRVDLDTAESGKQVPRSIRHSARAPMKPRRSPKSYPPACVLGGLAGMFSYITGIVLPITGSVGA